ncbi:hypothetical protein pb186bvf_020090 [Paramecium bursaria]
MKLQMKITGVFLICMIPVTTLSVIGYMQQDKSQITIGLTYFTIYQVLLIYIFILLLRQIEQEIMMVPFLQASWKKLYITLSPVIFINEIFSFLIPLYGLFNPYLSDYTIFQVFYYIISYYICNIAFSLYSRALFDLEDDINVNVDHRRYLYVYSYFYYFQVLVILISNIFNKIRGFYYSLMSHYIDPDISPLSQFLVIHLMYHIFEKTKMNLIINIYIMVVFIQVVVAGINVIKESKIQCLRAITIISVILSLISMLKILQYDYYEYIKTCRATRVHRQPTEQGLNEEDLQKVEIKIFDSIMEVNLTQSEELTRRTCSVCSYDVQKRELGQCLIPWLKMRNSCPNCRSLAIKLH